MRRSLSDGTGTVQEIATFITPSCVQRASLGFEDTGQRFGRLTSAVNVSGELDFPTLERALRMVVDAHDALRMHFVKGPDGWQCTVAAKGSLECLVTRVPVSERTEAYSLLYEADRFDVSRPPLFKLTAFTVDPEHCVLGLVVDHLVFDGTSEEVFWDHLLRSYAWCRNPSWPLPEARLQYSEFIAEESRRLAQDTESWEFWREYLGRFDVYPVLGFPVAAEVDRTRLYPRSDAEWIYTGDAVASIRSFADEQHMSLIGVFLAAAGAALSDYAVRLGEVGIIVNYANRGLPGSEGAIGHFAHALPFWFRTPDSGDLASWAQDIWDGWVDLLEYGHVPTPELIRLGAPHLLGKPIEAPAAVFDAYNAAPSRPSSGELGITRTYTARSQAEKVAASQVVRFILHDQGSEVRIAVEGSGGYLDLGFVPNLLGRWREAVGRIVAIS